MGLCRRRLMLQYPWRGGRVRPESVAAFNRNQWQPSTGIGGNFRAEYALKATAEVFLVRPSFLMPSMVGRTEAVGKALSLRHWGVPFDALVYVFGRDAMDWYRAELALGRPTIVGSTVKQPEKLPAH